MPTPRGIADPTAAILNYKEATANAGERWKRGVLNPRRSAKVEAKKKAKKWASGVQAAITGNLYEKGIDAIDESAIDVTVEALGAAVYTAGVAARHAKVEKRLPDALAKTKTVTEKVRDMPDTTPSERDARAAAFSKLRREAG
jgi:uncharacterized protein (DUF2164 family)